MVASGVEALRRALATRGDLKLAAAALAAGSAAALLLHLLARYRLRWARAALGILWAVAALGGAACVVYMIHRHPLCTWTAGQLLVGLLLAAVALRTVVALAGRASWRVKRSNRAGPA